MRTLVIGDVHGCFLALTSVLEQAECQPDDHLIFLGDLIDRGTESKQVLDWVCGRENVTVLRGNHEIMMLGARKSYRDLQYWTMCGGTETIQSYGPIDNDWPDRVPDAHWSLMQKAPAYIETDDTIYVHATPDPHLEMSDQDEYHLLWSKCRGVIRPHTSGKRIICGHTSQKDGAILNLGHFICIDTYIYGGGWLTCLDVDARRWYQADEDGETRAGQLRV